MSKIIICLALIFILIIIVWPPYSGWILREKGTYYHTYSTKAKLTGKNTIKINAGFKRFPLYWDYTIIYKGEVLFTKPLTEVIVLGSKGFNLKSGEYTAVLRVSDASIPYGSVSTAEKFDSNIEYLIPRVAESYDKIVELYYHTNKLILDKGLNVYETFAAKQVLLRADYIQAYEINMNANMTSYWFILRYTRQRSKFECHVNGVLTVLPVNYADGFTLHYIHVTEGDLINMQEVTYGTSNDSYLIPFHVSVYA